MSLKDYMRADMIGATLRTDEMAESAVLHKRDGSRVNTTVRLSSPVFANEARRTHRVGVEADEVEIYTTESVGRGDIFEIGGDMWRVTREVRKEAGIFVAGCTKHPHRNGIREY